MIPVQKSNYFQEKSLKTENLKMWQRFGEAKNKASLDNSNWQTQLADASLMAKYFL